MVYCAFLKEPLSLFSSFCMTTNPLFHFWITTFPLYIFRGPQWGSGFACWHLITGCHISVGSSPTSDKAEACPNIILTVEWGYKTSNFHLWIHTYISQYKTTHILQTATCTYSHPVSRKHASLLYLYNHTLFQLYNQTPTLLRNVKPQHLPLYNHITTLSLFITTLELCSYKTTLISCNCLYTFLYFCYITR